MDAKIFQNCLQSVLPECENATIQMTQAGFQSFADDIVSTVFFYYNLVFMAIAASLPQNLQLAANSLRCGFTIVPNQFSKFLKGWYHFFKNFQSEMWYESFLNGFYPTVCTCKKDEEAFAGLFGVSAATNIIFSSCSSKQIATGLSAL